jgi:hypothetical protein
MKKTILIFSLLIALFACSKDDDATPAGDGSFMKASVAGGQLDVSGPGSPQDTRGCTSLFETDGKTLYLYGNNGIIFIAIAIENFPEKTGTFTLGDIESGTTASYTDNTDKDKPVNYYSTSGSVQVTTYDGKTIDGTFSFKAYSNVLKKEVTVSNGQFNVPFTRF